MLASQSKPTKKFEAFIPLLGIPTDPEDWLSWHAPDHPQNILSNLNLQLFVPPQTSGRRPQIFALVPAITMSRVGAKSALRPRRQWPDVLAVCTVHVRKTPATYHIPHPTCHLPELLVRSEANEKFGFFTFLDGDSLPGPANYPNCGMTISFLMSNGQILLFSFALPPAWLLANYLR